MHIICGVIGSAKGHSHCESPEDKVTMAIVSGIGETQRREKALQKNDKGRQRHGDTSP